ncbi:MAG: hypothetical protein A2033_15200 [Bacteroidetes bacterium GWA2_31_9]|nr:MAG: hypothetical protein A2033_15200 [Bacteroidetes bacterium GWA2_31_9]
MKNDYQIILSKLDYFIRKYYKNQVLKGTIVSITIILFSYLFAIISEYFGNFSITARTIIFYSLVGLFLFVISALVIIPLLKLLKIGKTIDHFQAAKILSTHFENLQDKLINMLELLRINENSLYSKELLLASIDARIENIKPIPFQSAIKYKENLKFGRYLLIIFLLGIVISYFYPSVLFDGSKRIINHSVYFEPEAPFRFIIENDSLTCKKGDDFTISVTTEGKAIPENVKIHYSNNQFVLSKRSKNSFEYTFKNLNTSLNFSFSSGDVNSQKYTLNILPSPNVLDFKIFIDVPEYTGEKDNVVENTGDITVPVGSKIRWDFKTADISVLHILFNDSSKFNANLASDNAFNYEKQILESSDYKIIASNNFFTNQIILKYFIKVIPDLYPSVKILSVQDSINKNLFYFKGLINDDYGFENLKFIYTITGQNKSLKHEIPINKTLSSQEFYYTFNFSDVNSAEAGNIEYYFEVSDNDRINGSKSTKSQLFEYKLISRDELKKQKDEASESAQSKLSDSQKLAEELQKQVSDLKKDMLNKDMTEWEKTKKIEDIIKKQEQLERKIFEMQAENKMSNEFSSQLTEEQKELLEKQKQIEELLNNLMDDDMKKLFDELQELMNKMDEKKMNELTDKMEMSMEDLAKQLEKDLELLKKMEIEKKVDETAKELEKLAEKQKELSNKTEDSKNPTDSLKKEQEKHSEELEKLEKEYEKIQEKNSELEEPEKLKNFSDEFNEIKKEMNDAKQNLDKKNDKKASKSQKSASDKMKDLAQEMKDMMQQNQSAQEMQNMDDLRQIIDNLIHFSFNQEALMVSIQNVNYKDPKLDEYKREQLKISDDFSIIKDSLYSLSKKSPMISSAINKEISEIEQNILKIKTDFDDTRIQNVKSDQQFVMTSANNLALLLNEILKQMQEQMNQQQKPGNSQCNKPNPSNNPMPGMKKTQQSLKSQMEQMIEQLKKGEGKGKGDKFDKNAMNKQIAQMMAQQEIFNQKLNELKSKASLSPEGMKKLNEISQLNEQNLKDLINKNITPQLVKRQELILTRLLEAEKSDFEREIDKKRESKEAKNEEFRNPEEIFKYKGLNSQFNELLNLSNIELNKYYMDIYKEYLLKLNKNED